MSDTQTTIIGNCTRAPEARYTPSGANVTTLGIAVNTRRKNAGGEWEDGDPHFFDVKCWGTLAEHVANCVTRGTRLIVSGELEYRSWETDNGEKRSKVEIKAEAVGPDLRWAEASVTRIKGSGNSSGTSQSRPVPSEDPFA